MNYEETLKYLESFQRFGIRLGLANIRRLLKLLGNPEKRLKVIHIGGTNGKGSVGAFLFYILKEAGYKVGLYTSPHLVDFRERIRTSDGLISKEELTRLVKEVYRLPFTVYGFQPTFFEITTALALKYFADQRVDFAILEVGMGGRLDATNVTRPLVSVITNVDFEHTEHLGKSLRKIAYEKCGIIKEGIPVVTAEKKKEVLRIIEDTCRKKRARLYRVGKELRVTSYELRVPYQKFNLRGIYDSYKNLEIPLLGKHQLLNATCVLGAVELLRPKARITKKEIRKGLAKTQWPGRLEVIQVRSKKKLSSYQAIETGKPANRQTGKLITIILDGMHNVAGAKALKEAIEDCFTPLEVIRPRRGRMPRLWRGPLTGFTYGKLILVLGILKDKDIKGIVAQIAPLASRIIITKPQTHRAAEPKEIAGITKAYPGSIVIKRRVSQAIRQAISYAESKDIILITGSLYTIGEAKTYLEALEL